MVDVTARKITFEDLTSPIMVQEMFESYFENKPSNRIDEQINSFLNKNHSLTKLNAIKVFREFFNEKPHKTICFLSALRRYLRIDNDNNLFNSKKRNQFDTIDASKKELKQAIIEAISTFGQDYSYGNKELDLLIKYELVVFNKEQRNYTRALQLIEEMLAICKPSKEEDCNLFENDNYVHFLLSFDDPQKYIELQYNLIQSKWGFELKDMKFSSLHGDIESSNGSEQETTLNVTHLRKEARALLSKLDEKAHSPTRVFEEFYLLILDVLIRRYDEESEKQSNRDPKNSFIGDQVKTKFKKIKKLILRSHLSFFSKEGKNNVRRFDRFDLYESAREVRESLVLSYKSTYNALGPYSEMDEEKDSFAPLMLLNLTGDIDLNAPLAIPKNRMQWGSIHYFSNNKIWKPSPEHDLQEKIQSDMSTGIQGKINCATVFADAAFLNMMKVGKVRNSDQIVASESNEKAFLRDLQNLNEFEILGMLHQKATGQTIKLSPTYEIEEWQVPETVHSKETQTKLDTFSEQEPRFERLKNVFYLSAYFARGYNVQPWLDSKKDETITRSTKLDRLNILAKGISKLHSIVEEAIPHPYSKKLNRREDLPASESQPLLILPQINKTQKFSELDKTIFSIPFIVHRFSELVNALTHLNQYKNKLPIPYPYMRRFPILLNKYAALIHLEIKRMLEFIEQLEGFCKYDVNKKWSEDYDEHLSKLRQERNDLKTDNGKYIGKASAYKPLEIEREFVEALMQKDSEWGSKPITSCLELLARTVEDVTGKEYPLKNNTSGLFNKLVRDVFHEDGDFSPNRLIVGKMVGVDLTRGWTK